MRLLVLCKRSHCPSEALVSWVTCAVGPIAAALGGIAVGTAVDWLIPQLFLPLSWAGVVEDEEDETLEDKAEEDDTKSVATEATDDSAAKQGGKKRKTSKKVATKTKRTSSRDLPAYQRFKHMYDSAWEKGTTWLLQYYNTFPAQVRQAQVPVADD